MNERRVVVRRSQHRYADDWKVAGIVHVGVIPSVVLGRTHRGRVRLSDNQSRYGITHIIKLAYGLRPNCNPIECQVVLHRRGNCLSDINLKSCCGHRRDSCVCVANPRAASRMKLHHDGRRGLKVVVKRHCNSRWRAVERCCANERSSVYGITLASVNDKPTKPVAC